MPSYRGYRFPSEVISHAVWLYHRFSLSFRDVEDLLAEHGINVTYETIRQWCRTFALWRTPRDLISSFSTPAIHVGGEISCIIRNDKFRNLGLSAR